MSPNEGLKSKNSEKVSCGKEEVGCKNLENIFPVNAHIILISHRMQ